MSRGGSSGLSPLMTYYGAMLWSNLVLQHGGAGLGAGPRDVALTIAAFVGLAAHGGPEPRLENLVGDHPSRSLAILTSHAAALEAAGWLRRRGDFFELEVPDEVRVRVLPPGAWVVSK